MSGYSNIFVTWGSCFRDFGLILISERCSHHGAPVAADAKRKITLRRNHQLAANVPESACDCARDAR
jgi:hypothetical protein